MAMATARLIIPPTDLTFTPNLARLSTITRLVFKFMCIKDPGEAVQELEPALLEYYVTAILWARLIDLKYRYARTPLNETESQYWAYFKEGRFNLPEPIYDMIRMIGTIIDKRGYELRLADHSLPMAKISSKGGYHAAQITAENHNLFEEVPSLGVIGDVLMALSGKADGRIKEPFFPFLPPGTEASKNLVGFSEVEPVVATKTSAYFLNVVKISPDSFYETLPDTRFNGQIVERVSNLMNYDSDAFNIVNFCVSEMGIDGSVVQLIETHPSETSILFSRRKWTDLDVQPKYATRYPEGDVAISYTSGFQLYKEAVNNSHDNWCCVRANRMNLWNIPTEWIEHRNDRRKCIPNYEPIFVGQTSNQASITVKYCEKYMIGNRVQEWDYNWDTIDNDLEQRYSISDEG